MAAAVLLALSLAHVAPLKAGDPVLLWEEPVMAQQSPLYHPMIRFQCWDTTRAKKSATYVFAAPKMFQQGSFAVAGNRYAFHALMASEIENADLAKIMADMDPRQADKLHKDYAESMSDFVGTYNSVNRSLTITYRVDGVPKTYTLYDTREGDDKLPQVVSGGPAAALIGLWQAPDPHPGRLDATTRYKIELNGLQRFASEAMESNGALFGVINLRQDGTCRSHGDVGSWSLSGNKLTIEFKGKKSVLTVSADGQSLLSGSKVVFTR